MTGRLARTARTPRNRILSSLAAILLIAGCTNYYEIPIETPIKPKLDVSAFQRVLVAGFLAGGTDDVDGNLETTRLLRSQLRTKSELRVIDTDVLPLMEVAAEDTAPEANTESSKTDAGSEGKPESKAEPKGEAPQQASSEKAATRSFALTSPKVNAT